METALTWPVLLLALLPATIALLACVLLSRSQERRMAARDADQVAELRALRSELATLQQRLDEMKAQKSRVRAAEAGAPSSIYEYAVQYARDGMSAHEIAGHCGISVGEATLIVAMHQENG